LINESGNSDLRISSATFSHFCDIVRKSKNKNFCNCLPISRSKGKLTEAETNMLAQSKMENGFSAKVWPGEHTKLIRELRGLVKAFLNGGIKRYASICVLVEGGGPYPKP